MDTARLYRMLEEHDERRAISVAEAGIRRDLFSHRIGASALLKSFEGHPQIARLIARVADEMLRDLIRVDTLKTGIDVHELRGFFSCIDAGPVLVLADKDGDFLAAWIICKLPADEATLPAGDTGRWLRYYREKVSPLGPMFLAIPLPGARGDKEVTVFTNDPSSWIGAEYCNDEIDVFYDMDTLCETIWTDHFIDAIVDSKGRPVYRSRRIDDADMESCLIALC